MTRLGCTLCGSLGHGRSRCPWPEGAAVRPRGVGVRVGPSPGPADTGRNERGNGLLRGAPKGVVW